MQRLFAGGTRDNQLGEHGIEVAANGFTGLHAGVHAHAGPRGQREPGQGARSRHEVTAGVLTVEAELEAVPANLRVLIAEFLTACNAELLANEVQPGDLLGDRVLHLQSRIDLEEGNGAVLPDQELARTGTLVLGLLEDGFGGLVQAVDLIVGKEGCGSFFHELLVAALQ